MAFLAMRHRNFLTLLPAILLLSTMMLAIVACQEEKKNIVPDVDNAPEVPNMVTRDVETFISDSGITRFHITAKLWNIYEESKTPRWTFPYGLFLELYADNFKQNATVVCDSAIFFSDKRLWRLDGNIVMVSEKKDSLLTKELYWDQRAKRIYSDTSFVRIVNEDRIIEGYGFSSNERMTDYSIKKPTAIFPANNLRKGSQTSQGCGATKSSTPDSTRASVPQSSSNSPTPQVAPANNDEQQAPPAPGNRSGIKRATINKKAI